MQVCAIILSANSFVSQPMVTPISSFQRTVFVSLIPCNYNLNKKVNVNAYQIGSFDNTNLIICFLKNVGCANYRKSVVMF